MKPWEAGAMAYLLTIAIITAIRVSVWLNRR
jgi:hypothetical protein